MKRMEKEDSVVLCLWDIDALHASYRLSMKKLKFESIFSKFEGLSQEPLYIY